MSPSPTKYPPSFLHEAHRLRAFTPPFAFSAFFSPEDTLLCVCATEHALTRVNADHPRITELTTGSGLVGLHALMQKPRASLVGLDVDRSAIDVATSNASHLGVSGRAMFMLADLWSESTLTILREYDPDLLICNPPYIPEPQDKKLEIEAGSGADGTAHLMRTLEIAAELKPQSLALSWCSVSDPEKVLQGAARAGYALDSLYVVAIADGEYSRTVHEYLKGLRHAYINEQADTLAAVAPDGSASFSYLLMAGSFCRDANARDYSGLAATICKAFQSRGIVAINGIESPIPLETWMLNRWDELELRAILHGRNGENPRSR